jgi:hypothetical protein
VRPLLGLCLDDAFYFVTRERTRKGMNLPGTPAVVSLPGIAGSEERRDRRLSPNADGSGPQGPESTIGCPAGT